MANDPGTPTAHTRTLVVILITITAIGPASTQMFLPALPAMQADFGVATTTAQLTLSLAFFAVAFSEIGYGPWSDRSGRKPVVLWGLTLFLLGNVVCLVADDIPMLVFGRILQACGASVGLVLSRTIALDTYGPHKAASVISLTIAAMALAPMLAPTIGGLMTDFFGWRSIFALQLAISVLTVWAVWFRMPETNARRRSTMTLGQMIGGFGRILKVPQFLAYALNATFTMGVFFAFISAAPHVTATVFNRPATEFGLWFIIVAAGYVGGNLASHKFAERVGPSRMVVTGSVLGLASVGCIGLALELGGWTPWAIFVPGAVTSFAAGLSLPSAQIAAVSRFPDSAGSASALIGFLTMLVGAIVAQLVGNVQDATPYPMLMVLTAMSVLALSALVIRPSDGRGVSPLR